MGIAPEVWGAAAWHTLHAVSLSYPPSPSQQDKQHMQQFISAFAQVLPCDACARHLRDYIRDHPPRLESRGQLARWVFDLHNVANRHAQRPQYHLESFLEEWRERIEHGRVRPMGRALQLAAPPILATAGLVVAAERATSPGVKALLVALVLAVLSLQTFRFMGNALL